MNIPINIWLNQQGSFTLTNFPNWYVYEHYHNDI